MKINLGIYLHVTNDIDNTIDDDDIQFDPAQGNNNNDDNMDNTNDLDNAQDSDEQVPVTDEVEVKGEAYSFDDDEDNKN